MKGESRSESKVCFECGETKPLDCFRAKSCMRDGHENKCKDCQKVDNRRSYRRRFEDPEWRERRNNRNRKQQRLRYHSDPEFRERCKAQSVQYKKEHPKRVRAHNAINHGITAGKIARPTVCTACGATGWTEGHHPDYSKPLEVEWLCLSCHRFAHLRVGRR